MVKSLPRSFPARYVLIAFVVLLFLFVGLFSLSQERKMSKTQVQEHLSASMLVDQLKQKNVNATISEKSVDTPRVGKAQVIRIGREEVQVYEFPTNDEAESLTKKISSDGYTIDGVAVDWTEAPHVFKKNNLVVFYLGQNESVLQSLSGSLGQQIAGVK